MDVKIFIRFFAFQFSIQYLWNIRAHWYSSKAGVKAVNFVSAENCKYITKYIQMCLRPRVSPGPGPRPPAPSPLSDGWASVNVCLAHRRRWQTGHTGRAGGGRGHAILRPDPWHRPLTGAGGGRLERRPGSWCVCQCLWNMPLCLPINLELVPLHLYPESKVTVEDNTPPHPDAVQPVW